MKNSNKNSFSVLGLSVVTLVLVSIVDAELFTSLGHMRQLIESEAEVTKYLESMLDFQYDKLRQAESIVDEFKRTVADSSADPERFIGNPVNAFLLIKNLYKDLQHFVDTVNFYEKLKELVKDVKEKYPLPSLEDYNGAAVALHRLEDTYQLEPHNIRSGNLSSQFPSRPLTAMECFDLGKIAYEQEDFYHTIIWMNESLAQIELEGDNPTVNIIDVLDYYAFATAKQGNIFHALELTKRILKLDPNHDRSKANLKYYEKTAAEIINKIKGDSGNDEDDFVEDDPLAFRNPRPPHVLGYERDAYEALCRGDMANLSARRMSKLKCRYVSHNPMIKIAPIKEEQVHDEPPIWLYHDVITERQLQRMKQLASPKLKRAIVRSPITGNYETADYRISKSGWLRDEEDPILPYLTKLVSSITNLTMETAEEWQIANYGLGGQYEPHFDFARKSEAGVAFDSSIGNRIATWLFYLETPEIGGATVFPPIKVHVKPVRRSAAFWYNLLPSGDGDYRTRHAACPVLFGTKWVSNKWIHARGQEFVRPCNLQRERSEDF